MSIIRQDWVAAQLDKLADIKTDLEVLANEIVDDTSVDADTALEIAAARNMIDDLIENLNIIKIGV